MTWGALSVAKKRIFNGSIILGGSVMIVKELLDRAREARCAKERKVQRGKAGMLVLGVSIGCTVGAVAGILWAPRTGKETRQEVERRGRETWERIKDNVSSTGLPLVQGMEDKAAQVPDTAEKRIEGTTETRKEPNKKTNHV